jgi:hypothetical protein
MAIKRDKSGRFASNGGPAKASRALKSKSTPPAVARTGMAPGVAKGAGRSSKSGQSIGVGKTVRTVSNENKGAAPKLDRDARDRAQAKRHNMNKASGLAGASSRSGLNKSKDIRKIKGGLAKAAVRAVDNDDKRGNLFANKLMRRDKRKGY